MSDGPGASAEALLHPTSSGYRDQLVADYERHFKKPATHDKPRPTLLPARALLAVSDCLTRATTKHDDYGWLESTPDEQTDALLRHLLKYLGGEATDKESGISHLVHAAARALILVELTIEDAR